MLRPLPRFPPCVRLQVPKPDRIIVILSIHLDDETDVALGRAFCHLAPVVLCMICMIDLY